MKKKLLIDLIIPGFILGTIVGFSVAINKLDKKVSIQGSNINELREVIKAKDKQLESLKNKEKQLEGKIKLKDTEIDTTKLKLEEFKKDISFNSNNIRELSNISFPS